MFHNIRPSMLERMRFLEAQDVRDRDDGTPRMQRLRQVPPETGQFLALLAANAPAGAYVEVGASGGYSTLWLALAAEILGRRVTTFEILPDKARLAQETYHLAQVEHVVELVVGDARELIGSYEQIGFCFLDAEKEIYADIYEQVVPRLAAGGILAADNAINFRETLQPMLDRALTDERVDALIVPIGKGVLTCRKL